MRNYLNCVHNRHDNSEPRSLHRDTNSVSIFLLRLSVVKLKLFFLETTKQDKTLACLKKVIDENEKILDEQEKALEIRQNDMESLTTELNAERERADALAKEIERKETQVENMKEEIDFLTEENTKFEREVIEL